jgi:putative ABC transport system permease protein
MIQNFFKIALRNLMRYKSYALLNVAGLSLGIACSIVIFLLVRFHLNVDGYHKKADHIYRMVTRLKFEQEIPTSGVQNPFLTAFKNYFPEIKQTTHARFRNQPLISVGGQDGTAPQKFKEDKSVCQVDPDFFSIFDYQWLKGSPEELSAPFTAAITQKLATKYYGDKDPIGQTFLYNNWREIKVIGLLADVPDNTDIQSNIFMSYATYLASDAGDKEHWGGIGSSNQVYFILPEGVSAADIQARMPEFSKKYIAKDPHIYEYVLQPLRDIHFDTEFGGGAPKHIVWALALVGLFLLIAACINFVNMATAQALHRTREVGIRKVVGSGRGLIFGQFMTETCVITLLSTVLAVLLTYMALPSVRTLTKTEVFLQINDPSLWVFLFGLMVLTTLLAGFYPSLIISGFRPAVAIKGESLASQSGGFNIRRALVVAQFAVCQLLVITALVIGGQMQFIKNADLGFNPDAVINLPLPDSDNPAKLSSLRAQLGQITGVQMISFNEDAPAADNHNTTDCMFDNRTEQEPWMIKTKPGDDQYLHIFDLQLVAGRNVLPADSLREVLLTETAVRKLGVNTPADVIGKRIRIWGKWAEVAGVVRDFHSRSLQESIEPVVILPASNAYSNISLKIDLSRKESVVQAVEQVWNTAFPKDFFEYSFVDEQIANFYELEDVLLKLIRFFCGVAIFIACLGLYGLVAFLALRKSKEIGVRKVLGASEFSILAIFGKEFGLLLLIGFVLAAPLGYWAMQEWLNGYTYRISFGAGILLASIGFSAVIALITVAFQSLKAAYTNPVKSLRS